MSDHIPDEKVTVRTVDLGFAIARIRKDRSCIHADGSPNPWTTLTLMTPADTTDGAHQPAHSAIAFMNEDQLKVLIEALS